MRAIQSDKHITISTPLGTDQLYLEKVVIDEGLSQLSRIVAYAHTNAAAVDPRQLLGQPVTVTIPIYADYGLMDQRYYNGVVLAVASLGSRTPAEAIDEVFRDYQITIVPRAYFLKQRQQSRIFQNLSPLQIVTQVLQEHGVKVDDRTTRSYPSFVYKVQYGESDWDFVYRLLQHEGIFFLIEHADGEHTFVLADEVSVYTECLESQVAYFTGELAEAHIYTWSGCHQVDSGGVRQRGYNYLAPTAFPQAQPQNAEVAEQQGITEVYEYIAEAENISRTATTAQTQLEAQQLQQMHGRAESNCRSFFPGGIFRFNRHEDDSEVGKSYVISAIHVEASSANNIGEQGQEGDSYSNALTVLPSEVAFRSVRAAQKPLIHGVQTARVVAEANSKDGEEIHIDQYGRIHVSFHWDAEQQSSCWVRLSQMWAGNGRGAFFFPRIGDEVIVQFLEGDPDQPLITGSVYNGSNVHPIALPDGKTQSGFISRSSKEGGQDNYNALLFEDLKGQELFFTQAERDQQGLVKNNMLLEVGKDRQSTIKNNDTLEVGKVLTLKAGSEIRLEVGSAKITLKSDGTINIEGNNLSEKGTTIVKKASSIQLNS